VRKKPAKISTKEPAVVRWKVSVCYPVLTVGPGQVPGFGVRTRTYYVYARSQRTANLRVWRAGFAGTSESISSVLDEQGPWPTTLQEGPNHPARETRGG
jgi:hypothetical protein